MSATTFWGDVAECRRLLRHHRRVRDDVPKPPRAGRDRRVEEEMRKLTPARRVGRVLIPWFLVPMVGVARWDWLGLPSWVGIGLLACTVLTSLGINGPMRLTTFEALRVPSRRALFVARVVALLPWWLWIGIWGTVGWLDTHWGAVQNVQQAALYLLAGAQVSWLTLALLGAVVVVSRWLRVWFSFWIVLAFLLPFLLPEIVPQLATLLESHLPLIALAMLLLEVGLLSLQVWVLGRLEPMCQISGLMGSPPQKDRARGAKPAAAPPGRGVSGKLGPTPWLAGRHGLGWAAVYYAVRKLWVGGSRGFLGRLYLFVIIVSVSFPLASGHDPQMLWYFVIVLLIVPQVGGSALHVGNPQRLYLLGVDYRKQLAHRLRTFWVTPALLGTAVAVILATALWGETQTPLTLLALGFGLTLCREGCFGWPPLGADYGGRTGCLPQFLIILALALGGAYLVGAGRWAWLPGPGWDKLTRVQIFAACCGAFGLAGILYKWWRLDETRLGQLVQAYRPLVAPPVAAGGEGSGARG
jgi:hypothetical protein